MPCTWTASPPVIRDGTSWFGSHVTVRKSSFEVLEIFQNQPDRFDVIITDQTIPGMTGVDIARRMLQIRLMFLLFFALGTPVLSAREKLNQWE